MTASLLLQAIAATFVDLVVGAVVVCTIAGLLWLVGRAQKDRPERKRPEPVEPVDFAGEIRVHDRTRRGPEVLAGPELRERLSLSARRVA